MSSQVYTDYGAEYFIYATTKKNFVFTVIDPSTGKASDMSDTTLYSTASVTICDADGTIITTGTASYTNRIVNTSYLTCVLGPFTNTQAGNWKGFLKLLNSSGDIIDQQVFNFIVKEAF